MWTVCWLFQLYTIIMPCILHKVLYFVVSSSLLCSFPLEYHIISFIKNDFIHSFSPTLNSNCIYFFLFSIIVNLFNLSLVPRFFLQSFAYFSHFSARYVISHNLKLAPYLLNFGTLRCPISNVDCVYHFMVSFTVLPQECTMYSALGSRHSARGKIYPNQLLFPLQPTPALQPPPPPPTHPVPFRLYCHFQRHASTFVDPWVFVAVVISLLPVQERGRRTTTETIIQKYIKLQLLLP